jgi:cytidyltransferase-like protein
MAAGVFDFFHPGHRFFLEQAKALGDRLVVVVARDENVVRIKKQLPFFGETERKQQVEQSAIANEVLLGNRSADFLQIIERVNPQIIAFGYDQKIPERLKRKYPQIKIVQLSSHNPSSYKSSEFRKRANTMSEKN